MRLSYVPGNPKALSRQQGRMIPILTPQQIQKLNTLKRISNSQDGPRKSIRPTIRQSVQFQQYTIPGKKKIGQIQKNKTPKKYIFEGYKVNDNTTQETSRNLFNNVIKENEEINNSCCSILFPSDDISKPRNNTRPLRFAHWKT